MIKTLDTFSRWVTDKKIVLLAFLFLVNLPFFIGTFDTLNWSDDFQFMNLKSVMLNYKSWFMMLFEPMGGSGDEHFGPIFVLLNFLLVAFTKDPRVVHFQILVFHVLTGYMLYWIVYEHCKDRLLGVMSAVLFLLSYYVCFKALNWNCFHSHATNTFTGAVSIYLLIRYMNLNKVRYLFGTTVFLMLSVLNLESGFVFLVTNSLITLFYFLRRVVNFKKLILIGITILLSLSSYLIGSHFSLGKALPVNERLGADKSAAMIAFNTSELFIQTTGLATYYYKLAFNPLKDDIVLRDKVIRLLRYDDTSAIKEIAPKKMAVFILLGIILTLLFIFILVLIWTRVRKENYMFVVLYAVLFLIFVYFFMRIDVANSIALMSSVVIAEIIINLLRTNNQLKRRWGNVILGIFLLGVVLTIINKFDDCYKKSFFGIQKIAVHGPNRVYDQINEKLGYFVDDGIVFFTHDYTPYYRTTGFDRIGNMLSMVDLVSYNAAKYEQQFLKSTTFPVDPNLLFNNITDQFHDTSKFRKVIVNSKQEAVAYLNKHKSSVAGYKKVYMTRDYQIELL